MEQTDNPRSLAPNIGRPRMGMIKINLTTNAHGARADGKRTRRVLDSAAIHEAILTRFGLVVSSGAFGCFKQGLLPLARSG